MASAYGAGSGAEMLQSILRQKFAEAIQQQQMQQNQQRLENETALRQSQQASLDEMRKSEIAAREQNAVKAALSMIPKGTNLAPESAARARAAGFGDLVPHEQADLPSTALTGVAMAGAKAPTLGAVRIAAAGRPERDTFIGTAEEQAREQARQDALAKAAADREERNANRKSPALREYEDAVSQGFKGSFEDYQNTDANRKLKAAGGGEAKPYFTYQPVYDTSGRPISAIRFDARGGPPQVVDVSAMTGGGQLKPPPGTIAQQAIGNEVSSVQLGRLKDMFDKGARKLIGPAEGRARALSQQIPGIEVNKTFSDFKAATDAFKNSVIKAITGAQMSEPEAKRITGQIPTENDKPDVWLSKYTQTLANLADLGKVLQTKPGTPSAPSAPSGTPKRVRYDMNGNPIKD